MHYMSINEYNEQHVSILFTSMGVNKNKWALTSV